MGDMFINATSFCQSIAAWSNSPDYKDAQSSLITACQTTTTTTTGPNSGGNNGFLRR